MSSGLRSERSELAEAAKGGAGQFAESESLDPRREQARRDNGGVFFMWLSGQQKRPADCGEGQTGIVTMSQGEMAVMLDSERRGLEVYAPAGYHWTPQVGQRVLVIRGQGEIPGIVGVRGGGEQPDSVRIEAKGLTLTGKQMAAYAENAAIKAEGIYLDGQVYIREEKLEKLIERIVRLVLAGGSVG